MWKLDTVVQTWDPSTSELVIGKLQLKATVLFLEKFEGTIVYMNCAKGETDVRKILKADSESQLPLE